MRSRTAVIALAFVAALAGPGCRTTNERRTYFTPDRAIRRDVPRPDAVALVQKSLRRTSGRQPLDIAAADEGLTVRTDVRVVLEQKWELLSYDLTEYRRSLREGEPYDYELRIWDREARGSDGRPHPITFFVADAAALHECLDGLESLGVVPDTDAPPPR